MYKRILIATDGSELAMKGLQKGLELAAQLGAKVDIVTVSEPWAVGMYDAMGWSAGYEASPEYKQDREAAAQKILQPSLEASVAADDDPRRGVGSGLGHVGAGLRLRYEITRRFAPYVGFVHERRFGRSADLHRDAGEATRESRWVAGVRFWF